MNKRRSRHKNSNKESFFRTYRRIIIVLLELIILCLIFKYAPNYIKDSDNLKVYINNNNVTYKYEPFIKEKTLYISVYDLNNLLDTNTYVENDDNEKVIISISENKVIKFNENSNEIEVNNISSKIDSKVEEKNGVYYIPLSDIDELYNLEIKEHIDTNIINIESLNKEKKVAYLNKKDKLKYKDTVFSKTIESLKKGEEVIIISKGDKWTKVQSRDGLVGYVKTNKLFNEKVVRENLDISNEIKVENNEDVSVLSNKDIDESIDEITSNYESRKDFILRIMDTAISKRLKGVKVDFDNIENEDNYYRFLSELRPYLNDYGISLIVVKKDNLDENILSKIVNQVE